MTEGSIACKDRKKNSYCIYTKELKIRKSNVTLQWLLFVRARRYITMVVKLLKKLFVYIL